MFSYLVFPISIIIIISLFLLMIIPKNTVKESFTLLNPRDCRCEKQVPKCKKICVPTCGTLPRCRIECDPMRYERCTEISITNNLCKV